MKISDISRKLELEMMADWEKKNKVTKCPTKWANGIIFGGWKTTKIRNKKSCNYDFLKPIGLRLMNFNSVYNVPATNVNGAKMYVTTESTNGSMG
jgi:hypothetical protein